jgi:hypothetical protein
MLSPYDEDVRTHAKANRLFLIYGSEGSSRA